MKLTNKNIILTGASSGIGYEMLFLLMQYSGARIIAVARNIDNLLHLSDKVYPFSADVSTPEGVDSVFNYAHTIFEQTDIFIANAGLAYIEKIQKADWEHMKYIYSLNVLSPIYALEKLTSIGKHPKCFVTTISGAGLASLPAYSLYCSSKSALHHFIETYRYEKEDNLQLTAVYPVATQTEFFDKASHEKNFPLPFPQQKASLVARKIVKGIEKGKKKIYPSLLFRIFYPIGRAFPFFLKIYSLLEKRKVKEVLE